MLPVIISIAACLSKAEVIRNKKGFDVFSGLPQNLISNNKYLVRFASDDNEVREAQRLRYKVFNIELGEGLDSSHEEQLDRDRFDQQCHHLLVLDRDNEQVIGTYRMQTYTMARKAEGFYTSTEFDLSRIPQEVIDDSIEVGRACIAKEHRNGRVLFLLWRGLAKYLDYTGCRYLFGCCSLTSQDPLVGWNVMQYLEEQDLVHKDFLVPTLPVCSCPEVSREERSAEGVELPQLFRLYMDIGAKACSLPALDKRFKTIDYLVILDIQALDERMKMLFFQ